jgi:FkbM family methyltransferase
MKRCRLPDGLEIAAPNALEAAVLYREIVTERTYERHGIRIRPGDVVFDVGANIGLFSIHLARTVPGARLYAFEPAPPVFDMLTRNLAQHAPDARAFNTALGDRDGDAELELNPFMTIAATMDRPALEGAADRTAPATAWAAAALADLHRTKPSRMTALLSAALDRPVARQVALAALTPLAVATGVRRRLFRQRHRCQVRTTPAAMRAAGVDAIDLMKIDVEGAEEAVLAGIDTACWSRIRQLVVEVHDVDGRLARLRALLERHGYRTTTDREDWALHALLGISMLYATRD